LTPRHAALLPPPHCGALRACVLRRKREAEQNAASDTQWDALRGIKERLGAQAHELGVAVQVNDADVARCGART
jgi:hypothetical protein